MQTLRKIDLESYNDWKNCRTVPEIMFISEKYNNIYIEDIDVTSDFIGETIYIDIVDTNLKYFKKKSLSTTVLKVPDSDYLIRVVFDNIMEYILRKYRQQLFEMRRLRLLSEIKSKIGGNKQLVKLNYL